MNREFSLLKEYIQYKDKENLKVSKGNVGWHIDHSLKVINNVYETVKESNPLEYKKEFNALRTLTFAIGSFPRGKARAPKRVTPPAIIEIKDIESQLEWAIKNLETLDSFEDDKFFTHPIFKQINKKQTIKFLRLHTNHHLKIVKDILK